MKCTLLVIIHAFHTQLLLKHVDCLFITQHFSLFSSQSHRVLVCHWCVIVLVFTSSDQSTWNDGRALLWFAIREVLQCGAYATCAKVCHGGDHRGLSKKDLLGWCWKFAQNGEIHSFISLLSTRQNILKPIPEHDHKQSVSFREYPTCKCLSMMIRKVRAWSSLAN